MCEQCRHIATYGVYDPTHTTTLRNLFAQKMTAKFQELCAKIIQKVYVEDFFELKNKVQTNAPLQPFGFPRSRAKVEEFMIWLREQVEKGILNVTEYETMGNAIEDAWTNLYVTDSYKRGIIRARYELQKRGYDVPSIDETGGVNTSMMLPLHMDRLGLLYTRVYSDLKGITAEMDMQISRVLTQAMADGDNALITAKKLVAAINGTGIGDLGIRDSLGRFIPAEVRAEMLARTEIIRAHHQAMIQEYMNWRLEEVIVEAEVVTAGDDRVCDECYAIAGGGPYPLDVAMNLIPVHPRCRCIALPFEAKFDTRIPNRRG